jgi:hypothetical protein
MYERYGNDAIVTENKMHDDPVKTLHGKAKKYIEKLSTNFIKLHEDIKKLSNQIQNMENPDSAIVALNKYLSPDSISIDKIGEISNKMLRATKRKIALMILENNYIYGYTVDSIIEKKLPPPNHAMVSLFVENPFEPPEEQKVTDIIKDVKSFHLIAANEKKPIFDVSNVTTTLIAKGVQSSDLKSIREMRGVSLGKVKNAISSAPESKEDGKALKQIKLIWRGLDAALNFMIGTKKYIADLVNAYFTMMVRIDNLCKVCVVALLDIERERRDTRSKVGFGIDKSKNANKGYRQNEDNYKTLGERDKEKEEAKNEFKGKISDLKESLRKARLRR